MGMVAHAGYWCMFLFVFSMFSTTLSDSLGREYLGADLFCDKKGMETVQVTLLRTVASSP